VHVLGNLLVAGDALLLLVRCKYLFEFCVELHLQMSCTAGSAAAAAAGVCVCVLGTLVSSWPTLLQLLLPALLRGETIDAICIDGSALIDAICIDGSALIDAICIDAICIDAICIDAICIDAICIDGSALIDAICIDAICIDGSGAMLVASASSAAEACCALPNAHLELHLLLILILDHQCKLLVLLLHLLVSHCCSTAELRFEQHSTRHKDV
jgi:hypothetical protein